MSCVVGLVADGVVWMGADSAGISGLDLVVRKDGKIFRSGEFLFGIAGSFRFGDLLRYRFQPPPHPEGMETREYLATAFIDALRDCLKAGGAARKENDVETADDGLCLVGYRGRLFTIFRDYQVAENQAPFAAIGCGADFALGALTALWDNRDPCATVDGRWLSRALDAAEQWSAGVRAPFVILCASEDVPDLKAHVAQCLASAWRAWPND